MTHDPTDTESDDFVTHFGTDGNVLLFVAAAWTLVCMVIFLMFDPSQPAKGTGQDVWAPYRPVVMGTFPPQIAILLIAGVVARLRPKLGMLSAAMAFVLVAGAQVAIYRWHAPIFSSNFYWITVGPHVALILLAGWKSRSRQYRRAG